MHTFSPFLTSAVFLKTKQLRNNWVLNFENQQVSNFLLGKCLQLMLKRTPQIKEETLHWEDDIKRLMTENFLLSMTLYRYSQLSSVSFSKSRLDHSQMRFSDCQSSFELLIHFTSFKVISAKTQTALENGEICVACHHTAPLQLTISSLLEIPFWNRTREPSS